MSVNEGLHFFHRSQFFTKIGDTHPWPLSTCAEALLSDGDRSRFARASGNEIISLNQPIKVKAAIETTALSIAVEKTLHVQPADPATFVSQQMAAAAAESTARACYLSSRGDKRPSDQWNLDQWLVGAIHSATVVDCGLPSDDEALRFLRELPDRDSLAKLLCTGELLNSLVDVVWSEAVKLRLRGNELKDDDKSLLQGARGPNLKDLHF